MSRAPTRFREAREYIGLSVAEVAEFLDLSLEQVHAIEDGCDCLARRPLERIARLYRRPPEFLNGEPAKPVDISPELHQLMERLSDHDRGEVVRFAEWLQGARPAPAETEGRADE